MQRRRQSALRFRQPVPVAAETSHGAAVQAAKRAMTLNTREYIIECSCGWWTFESRDHLIERASNHYRWWDATDSCRIAIRPSGDDNATNSPETVTSEVRR